MSVHHLSEHAQADEPVVLTEADATLLLKNGVIQEQGLLPYSSNYSFLVTVTHKPERDVSSELSSHVEQQELTLPAVYKPQRGENPLWDFQWGTLYLREIAAFEISLLLDWHLVPPTILREGPHGVGSVQLYIPNNQNNHYFSIQADPRHVETLRQMALFDYVINNADRKSGHCLVDYSGRLWAIDHGVCFHAEYKLRTVIWEFSSQTIGDQMLEDLIRLQTQLDDPTSDATNRLQRLLSAEERFALQERLDTLVRTGKYPSPDEDRRNYPWPPI